MKSSSSRTTKRTFRLEGLEDRNLLSLASPALHALRGQPAEIQADAKTTLVPVTTLHGTAQGVRAPNGLYGGLPLGSVSYSGHGSARPIGPALLGLQHAATRSGSAVTISNGTARITDSRTGEEVNIYYNGAGTTLSRGRGTSISLVGNVVSGTGQFVTATGSFTANGRISATGRLTLTYNVAIV